MYVLFFGQKTGSDMGKLNSQTSTWFCPDFFDKKLPDSQVFSWFSIDKIQKKNQHKTKDKSRISSDMDFLNKMQKPLLSMYTYTVYICMAICSLLCSCLNCEQRVVWREFFSLRAQWRVEPLFGWLGCCHFTVGPNLKNPQKIRLTKFVKLTYINLFLLQFDKF